MILKRKKLALILSILINTLHIYAINADVVNPIIHPDNGRWTQYNHQQKIYSVAIDSLNNKWFGSKDSIVKYNDISWSTIELGYSFGEITKIVIDLKNIHWFRVLENDVYVYNVLYKYDGKNLSNPVKGEIFENPYSENWHAFINDIFVDKKNIKWIAHEVYGILSFNDIEWTRHYHIFGNIDVSWKDEKVGGAYDIAVDYDDKVWYAASEGAWALNEEEPFIDKECYVIEVDKYNVKWFCGNGRLWSYDGKDLDFYKFAPLSDNIKINEVAFGKNDEKWFLSDYYLICFDADTWSQYELNREIEFEEDYEGEPLKALDFAVDNNGVVWICMEHEYGVVLSFNPYGSTSVDEAEQTPESIPLITTYPNPFNPWTTIEFTLPESGFATITIYSLAGQKIRELIADFMPVGTHTLMWDGKDTNGTAVSSGIYITRLQAGKHIATGRMVLVR